MARPRVLYVSATADMKGGAESVLMTMLANPLVDPVLAAPEAGAVSEAAAGLGVPTCFFHPGAMMQVHRPPRPGPLLAAGADLLRCAVRVRRLAKQHGCTVVHSNGMKPHVINAAVSRMGGVGTVVHLHDIPHRRAERAIWRAVGAAVNQVIVVSPPCWPQDDRPAKVHVIPNGFVPLHPALPPHKLGDTLHLGFVGRFSRFKGLDLLLDWAGAVRAAGLRFKLHIRGRPDPDDPGFWQEIQARIVAEGLSDLVALDGWRPKHTVYEGLDVVLLPSRIPDPLPLAAAEAMGAGVVVAIYPAGGMVDYVQHGHTGLVIPEPAVLANALGALIARPDEYQRLRRGGYQVATEVFGLDRFHQRLADIYRGMAA